MKIEAKAAPKSTSWRRATIVVGLTLLSGAALWLLDVWLFARLRVIASDTFTNGGPQRPQLFIEAPMVVRSATLSMTQIAEANQGFREIGTFDFEASSAARSVRHLVRRAVDSRMK